MTARFAINNSVSSCTAAACASARICNLLDAAILLVVSICVLWVRVIWQFA